MLSIQFAEKSDVERILEIYTPYVLKTSISFESTVPNLNTFREYFYNTRNNYPWLVCKIDKKIVGYAYASSHRLRSAYKWSVDASVYVDSAYHRKAVGKNLYKALFEILKHQGFHNAFAGITLPNPASEKLHKSFGFSKVGIYKNVGYKFEKWHDVVWYQLELKSTEPPKDPISIEGYLTEQDKLSLIEGNNLIEFLSQKTEKMPGE